MSGNETVTRQQKNTSFGANEFRDGISYSEQQQKKLLIEPSDLASLATGQCYAFLPEPRVRIAKIQTPEISLVAKNKSFVAKAQVEEGAKEEDTDTASEITPNSEGTIVDDILQGEVAPDTLTSESSRKLESEQSKKTNSKEHSKSKRMEIMG